MHPHKPMALPSGRTAGSSVHGTKSEEDSRHHRCSKGRVTQLALSVEGQMLRVPKHMTKTSEEALGETNSRLKIKEASEYIYESFTMAMSTKEWAPNSALQFADELVKAVASWGGRILSKLK